jgi:DNA-binding transcriptional MerR regulator
MIILEEIVFNSMMPWSIQNSDDMLFAELNSTINPAEEYNTGLYFSMLLRQMKALGMATEPDVDAELRLFSGTRGNISEGLYKDIAMYRHADHRIRFYATLAATCAWAEQYLLTKDFEVHTDDNYRKYKLRVLLMRLERIIAFTIPEDALDETAPAIIKIVKISAIVLYLDLLTTYAAWTDLHRLQLQPDAVESQLVMASMELDNKNPLVAKILKAYSGYLRDGTTSPSPSQKKIKGDAGKGRKGASGVAPPAGKANSGSGKTVEETAIQQKNEPPKQPDDPIIGSGDVMRMLGIGRTTLLHYRNKGLIPFSRPNPEGRIFYRLSEIQAFAKTRKMKKE